jgi:hypothetical protein
MILSHTRDPISFRMMFTCIATLVVMSGSSVEATGKHSGSPHPSTTRVVSRSSPHLQDRIITTFLTFLSPSTALVPENDRTTKLLDGLYKNAVLYGFSLVFTASIQTLQKHLDMYHVIFMMQIIFSLDFVYAYGAACVPFGTSVSVR